MMLVCASFRAVDHLDRLDVATNLVACCTSRRGWEGVELLVALPFTTRPGVAPAGELLFFASPKKPNEKKGDPGSCVPTLRFGQPAVLGPVGVWRTTRLRLKQAPALIRLALRSSTHTQGFLGLRGAFFQATYSGSQRTSVFTELAIKQASCAS